MAVRDPYDEFMRVYGPPQGTFDVEWVTRIARERRPDLPWATAWRLVEHAWRHLWASPQLSVDDLADYVALDEPAVADADVAAVVGAAVDFCDAYDVEPPRA